jgi:hypothetical protein
MFVIWPALLHCPSKFAYCAQDSPLFQPKAVRLLCPSIVPAYRSRTAVLPFFQPSSSSSNSSSSSSSEGFCNEP